MKEITSDKLLTPEAGIVSSLVRLRQGGQRSDLTDHSCRDSVSSSGVLQQVDTC